MTPVSIVRARPEDADALVAVIDAAYAPFRSRLPDLPDVSGGIPDDIRTRTVWVARIDVRAVGILVLAVADGTAHLANIAVHPDVAGKGVGKALIETAEGFARGEGVARIDLATHVGMPVNVALYGHLGWYETGRDGNKVYMSKALS